MNDIPSRFPAGSSGASRPHIIGSRRRIPPTYHKDIARLFKMAGIASAVAAGVSTSIGLMSPVDGVLSGIVVPIISGSTVGLGFGIGWHGLATVAPRVSTSLAITGTVASAVSLAALQIWSSSFGVATALSGRAAIRAYQADMVAGAEHALSAAWIGAQSEFPLTDAVRNAAAEMRTLAAIESKGGLTFKKGNGPATEILGSAADRYDRQAAQMQERADDAERTYQSGRDALLKMQQEIGKDSETFSKYASENQAARADLNAFHLTSLASQGGITEVEITRDQGVIRRILSGADSVKQKILSRVREIAAKRQSVSVPAYVPIEPREATLRYAWSAALGGWITAVGIDLFPLLFVILLLVTARDPVLLRDSGGSKPDVDVDYDHEADRSYREHELDAEKLSA